MVIPYVSKTWMFTIGLRPTRHEPCLDDQPSLGQLPMPWKQPSVFFRVRSKLMPHSHHRDSKTMYTGLERNRLVLRFELNAIYITQQYTHYRHLQLTLPKNLLKNKQTYLVHIGNNITTNLKNFACSELHLRF